MRPIDADEILDIINNENYPDYQTYSDIFDVIDSAPTIESKPVRHGRWNKIQNFAKCSECMHEVNWGSKDFLSPYCPNCGAKMDGGNE